MTWVGRLRLDSCNRPDDAGNSSTYARFSAETCTLSTISEATWCFSGEAQCDNRQLSLQVQGDVALGVMTFSRCWCPLAGPSPATDSDARALRHDAG